MAYVAPTVDEFRAQFGEFAALQDADILKYIELAKLFVDETWLEADYKPALLYLAAHYAAMARSAALLSGVGGGSGSYVRSVSFGDRRIVYGTPAGGVAAEAKMPTESLFGTTMYGQLYLLLLRRNAPVALIV